MIFIKNLLRYLKNSFRLLGLIMSVFFLLSTTIYAQQTIIWEEDFSYDDATITGHGSTGEATWEADGVEWNSWCYHGIGVVNKTLQGRYPTYFIPNKDTWQILDSDPIEIDGYANVSITLDIAAEYYFSGTDNIQVQYSVDNGNWTTFSVNGNVSAQGTYQAKQVGLSGDDLVLRVVIVNHAAWQYAYVDNIEVVGTLITSSPDCTSAVSPSNGETDVAIDEVISWNRSEQAIDYKFSLGTDLAATNIENGTDLDGDTSYTFSSDFDYLTTYYWSVIPSNSFGEPSSCETFSFTTQEPDYCPSFGYSGSSFYLTNVSLNTINNSSGQTSYSDFTSVSTSVDVGNSYALTANFVMGWNTNTYVRAWVDWNRDGDFDDANESFDIGNNSTGSVSGIINVPSTALSGKLRMRVTVSANTYVDACATNSYHGEVEDYSLFVEGIPIDTCAYDANANNVGNVTPCFGLPDTIITYLDDLHYGGDYFTLDVIQGLEYNIRTCMAGDESQSVNLSVYNDSTKAFEAFSNSNTANDCSSDEHDVNLVFTASFSGKVRVVLSNRFQACGVVGANDDINIQIFVSGGSNTLDSEDDAGADSWIGHLYKGKKYGDVHGEENLHYLGYYTERDTFEQGYGGKEACFDVYSDGEVRAQVFTEHFIARYKMNSTKKGLYVADIGLDDGSRLTVDSLVVYNKWSNHSFFTDTSVLFSLTGESSLLLDYYENVNYNILNFNNLRFILQNILSNHLSQTVFLGNEGSAISGDVYGALPNGISLDGTGYQWAYCSAVDSGNWTDISGATGAEYTPNSNASPFNTSGEYYIIRKASLSSINNDSSNPYVATNESNVASLIVKALPTVSLVGGPTICGGDAAEFTIYGDSGYVVTFDGDTSGTVILGIGDSVTLLVHNVVADVILNLTQVSNASCNAALLVSDTVGVLNSKAVSYDGFSDNAYGWIDGSSLSDWTGGIDPLKYSVSDIPEPLFYENDSSGIFVDGGSGCLFNNVGTSGSSQSKSVSRTPDNIMNKTFYISFLARFSMQPSSNWSYMGVGHKKIDHDNGVVLGCLGNVNQLGGTFGDDGDVMDMVSGVKVDSMKTYFVVGKWTVGAGGVTDIDFWLNPTALKTPHARYHRSVTLGTVDADMTSIDIQSYFPDTVYFDEIRYGFSWESVVPHHILVSSDDDNIITFGDEVTFTAYGGGDYAFYLNDVLVQGRSADSSYVTSDLENKDKVSVIVYHENGCDIDTDEIVTLVLGDIQTDSVTQIEETSAVLYGSISKASDVVDYGFYISSDNDTSLLISGSASEVKPTSVSTGDLSDLHFSCSSDLLTNRSGYYFRAYLKDVSGQYVYGNVQRFITEKRDFSLYLDGDDDCVVVDKESVDKYINDWGPSNNTFSIDMWFKKESPVSECGALVNNLSDITGYDLFIKDGAILLTRPGQSSVKTLEVITDTNWHHFALTYDGDSVSMYVDDSLRVTQETICTRPTNVANCYIGCRFNPNKTTNALTLDFEGNIDALRFWNVALTADQISELLYDNVMEGDVPNTVKCVGSGKVIPLLAWDNLTASMGFNVLSTEEAATDYPDTLIYNDQTEQLAYPFFHNDARLGDDKRGFNAIAIGNAKPSPYLPRVYWKYNASDSVWTDSNNWGSYAYPGQGVHADDYLDVTTVDLANDSAYCQYVIVDKSTHSACVIGVIPPEVQVLVDRDNSIGTYSVDESAELTILKGVFPSLFSSRVEMSSGSIVIEGGAVEVFD